MDAARESAAPTTRVWAGTGSLWASAALLVGAVFFGGGSGDSSVPVLGGLAVGAAAVALAAAAYGLLAVPRLDRAGVVAGGAGVGLVAWGGLSLWWSIAPDRSWDALNKGLVYAAFAVLGLVLAGRGAGGTRRLGLVLAAVLGLALAWSLAGKAVPSLFPDGDRVGRLRNPVGYWNGLAVLADAAVPVGLWLATSTRGRLGRMSGALLVYGAVLALLLTQSRAGVVAALAVTALWLCLAPERVAGALTGVLAAAPALAVGAWAFTRPALVEDGVPRADRVADGRLFAVLALAAAAAVLALVLGLPVARLAAQRRREVTRALTGAAALLAAGGAAALVLSVGNPLSWAADQFSQGECANDPSRLTTLCANNRTAWWGEAWDVFTARPVAGSGAHTFEIARRRYRDDATSVSEPHSVPLQLLADAGLVGLALGVALAVGLGLALAASVRRLSGPDRAAAVALAGLPAAFALHALVDYDLDFVALAGPALLVSFALAGAGRRAARLPHGLLPAAGWAVTAAAAIFALASPALADREVDRSTDALAAGHADDAARAAERARSLNPLALDPLYAQARAYELAGEQGAARLLYTRATELQPENPQPWIELGLFELQGNDDACAGYVALNNAYTLDPKSRLWIAGGPLDLAREEVNAGACER